MSQKSGPRSSAEQHVREICRQTRKQYSAEEKIRIVLEGLRSECSIAELCHPEESPRACTISGRRTSSKLARSGCLATRRAKPHPLRSTSTEVKELRQEASDLKEALAETLLENRLLKKSMIADGGDQE